MPRHCRLPMAASTSALDIRSDVRAADQEKAAAELIRVCRQGGRIGLANWTPDGFAGELFRTFGRYVPPPPGLRSPALWVRNKGSMVTAQVVGDPG